MYTHPCSWQHQILQPGYGNNPNTQWQIYTMKYTTLRTDEILWFSAIWMEVEGIILMK